MQYSTKSTLGYNINITAHMVRSEFARRIAHLGVAPEQYGILYFINSHPGLTQSEIAQIICKSKTTITRMTDALVKKQLIIKEWCADDKRRQNVEITKTGKEVLENALPIAQELSAQLQELLTPDEQEAVFNALNKIQDFCKMTCEKDGFLDD